MPKLKIFISSTCYDLSMLREQLRKSFLESEYDPILSDYNDVFFDPTLHSHTSCVKEVANCDVLVLVIGGRFGGTAVSESLRVVDFASLQVDSKSTDILNAEKVSITQIEVLRAVELNIPIFTFVLKGVLSDHNVYQNNRNNSHVINSITFPSIEKQHTAKYIFDFIDFMRHRNRNNAIFEFSMIDELLMTIKRQFSLLFQSLLASRKSENADITSIKLELQQVKYLNWNLINADLKEHMYQSFMDLEYKAHKPLNTIVDAARQVELGELNSLSLQPLFDLLNVFNISYNQFEFPIDMQEYEEIHVLDKLFANQIYDFTANEISEIQKKAVRAMYHYLSHSNNEVTREDVLNCDVVIVPGARKGLLYRVDEALKICSRSNAYMIFSGYHPYYEENVGVPIGEAEAMKYYALSKKKFDRPDRIIIENRARNTKETAIHVIPDLERIYKEKERPLKVILVTSPYHMRRFFYLASIGLENKKHLIDSIKCVVSSTSYDIEVFKGSGRYNEERRKYGILLYLQEYFKLIGGRATGEF